MWQCLGREWYFSQTGFMAFEGVRGLISVDLSIRIEVDLPHEGVVW